MAEAAGGVAGAGAVGVDVVRCEGVPEAAAERLPPAAASVQGAAVGFVAAERLPGGPAVEAGDKCVAAAVEADL